MRAVTHVLALVPYALCFLFPTLKSRCSCSPCAPIPVCLANPTCPPVQRCPVVEQRNNREKRDTLDGVVKVDGKCNSVDLRTIIIENIDRVTAVSKRKIIAEIGRRLSGRYNVICASADLSYITNTEEFCQQTVGDVTCYVFKQLSDSVRSSLA